jgi:hypothetical protein
MLVGRPGEAAELVSAGEEATLLSAGAMMMRRG